MYWSLKDTMVIKTTHLPASRRKTSKVKSARLSDWKEDMEGEKEERVNSDF